MRSLVRRLWHSPTLMTWGSLGVRLLSLTLVLPLVLVHFSAPEVAVWQLFVSIYTMQMLFDFGLAPTFSRMLSYARGGATLEELADMRRPHGGHRPTRPEVVATVMGAQRWLYVRLCLAVVMLFAVVGSWALVKPLAQVHDPVAGWTAWAVVLATSAIGFWGNGYSAALQGMDKIAVMRRWEILFSFCQIASAVGVVAAGGGLLWLVVANQAWLVVGAVRNRVLLRHLHPELFALPAHPDRGVLAALWPAAWRSGLGVLMSQGLIQASGLIYSQFAQAAEVASYMLALRFATMISQFSQAPFYSKLPMLAQLHAQGSRQAQLELASRGMKLAHWVFVAGAVGVAAFASPALHWIGSRTPFVPTELWLLIALAFFVERYGAMYLQLYSTTNHIVWHIANGVTGLAMVVLAWVLFPHIGVWAMPLAMLVAYAGFYAWYAVLLASKAFGFSWLSFEKTCVLAPAVTGTAWVLLHQLVLRKL